MQRKSARARTVRMDTVQAIFLQRVKLIALFILAVCAMPSGSYADDTAGPGGGHHPAPVTFTVGARVEQLYFYPCADCHAYMDANNKVRVLDVEKGHPATLEHGSGQIWCLSCHDSSDPESHYGELRSLLAEPVEFNDGYQVCSGCHSRKYRDWTHGAHGKRAANWRGERRLYSCMECHNPHQPSIAPRAPKPPPPIRAGLKTMAPGDVDNSRDSRQPEWEQIHARSKD